MFPVLAMSPESVEFEPPNKDEAKPDINSPVRLSRKRRYTSIQRIRQKSLIRKMKIGADLP
jgi:hypothetical protein